MARLAITADSLTAANTLITEVEAERAEYLKEVGESQDATKTKDAAIAKMDDWMNEFYAGARIGLEDSPQLLEALGKVTTCKPTPLASTLASRTSLGTAKTCQRASKPSPANRL